SDLNIDSFQMNRLLSHIVIPVPLTLFHSRTQSCYYAHSCSFPSFYLVQWHGTPAHSTHGGMPPMSRDQRCEAGFGLGCLRFIAFSVYLLRLPPHNAKKSGHCTSWLLACLPLHRIPPR